MAKNSLRAGARVSWNTSRGETTGKVVRKATRPLKVKSFKIAASKGAPRFVVRSEKTGKTAAHKASALKRKS